ncbi:Uncharacterised protein [uncultured archaeon]|nr:Uncharacterised protein [uncultured archaeon]
MALHLRSILPQMSTEIYGSKSFFPIQPVRSSSSQRDLRTPLYFRYKPSMYFIQIEPGTISTRKIYNNPAITY